MEEKGIWISETEQAIQELVDRGGLWKGLSSQQNTTDCAKLEPT